MNNLILCYIISISFQFAGAVILLTSFCGNTKQKIVNEYYSGSNFVYPNDNKIRLNKQKKWKCASTIYLNRVAFAYVAIGYITGVFGDIQSYNRGSVAIFIVAISAILIIVGKVFCVKLSKFLNKEDETITFEYLINIKPDIDVLEDFTNEDIADIIERAIKKEEN